MDLRKTLQIKRSIDHRISRIAKLHPRKPLRRDWRQLRETGQECPCIIRKNRYYQWQALAHLARPLLRVSRPLGVEWSQVKPAAQRLLKQPLLIQGSRAFQEVSILSWQGPIQSVSQESVSQLKPGIRDPLQWLTIPNHMITQDTKPRTSIKFQKPKTTFRHSSLAHPIYSLKSNNQILSQCLSISICGLLQAMESQITRSINQGPLVPEESESHLCCRPKKRASFNQTKRKNEKNQLERKFLWLTQILIQLFQMLLCRSLQRLRRIHYMEGLLPKNLKSLQPQMAFITLSPMRQTRIAI